MATNRHIKRSGVVPGAVLVVALGTWAVLAPLLVGVGEAWGAGFDAFAPAVLPGGAAAVGGLAMLTGSRRPVAGGGALALASGLWLLLWPMASVVAPGAIGVADLPAFTWMVFLCGSGAMIALVGAYALGLLDALFPPLQAAARPRTPAAIRRRGRPALEPLSRRRALARSSCGGQPAVRRR